MALIGALCAALPGEVKRIDAYRANVQPCTDCRHCWTQVGCAIDDGMQEIYRDIAVADCIVLASPVYFSCLTGPLMSLLSRLQVFYTAQRFHGVRMAGKPKVGAILLCGGGSGSLAPAEETACGLLRCMNASHVGTVSTHQTDAIRAAENTALLAETRAMAEKLVLRRR